MVNLDIACLYMYTDYIKTLYSATVNIIQGDKRMKINGFINPKGIIGRIILRYMNLTHRIPWKKADSLLDFSQAKDF